MPTNCHAHPASPVSHNTDQDDTDQTSVNRSSAHSLTHSLHSFAHVAGSLKRQGPPRDKRSTTPQVQRHSGAKEPLPLWRSTSARRQQAVTSWPGAPARPSAVAARGGNKLPQPRGSQNCSAGAPKRRRRLPRSLQDGTRRLLRPRSGPGGLQDSPWEFQNARLQTGQRRPNH